MPSSSVRTLDRNLGAQEIQEWLVAYLAKLLELPQDDVDSRANFKQFGMDSAATVGLTGDLGEWLGYKIDPTLAYDYPTIEDLAKYLAQRADGGAE